MAEGREMTTFNSAKLTSEVTQRQLADQRSSSPDASRVRSTVPETTKDFSTEEWDIEHKYSGKLNPPLSDRSKLAWVTKETSAADWNSSQPHLTLHTSNLGIQVLIRAYIKQKTYWFLERYTSIGIYVCMEQSKT